MKTRGISPKVWAPTAALLITFVVNLIASGEFDRTEIAQLVGAVLTAVVGYLAGPGDVEYDAISAGGVDSGQTVVEALLIVFLVLVVLIVVFRLA